MISDIVLLVIVAALWGGTNPFLKKNSSKINEQRSSSKIGQFFLEIKYLITNIQYLLPMAFNQLGSVIYFLTLQKSDISIAVPVANSLSFVFTAIIGWFLGEDLPKKRALFGVFLVFLGSVLLCYDKLNS